MLGDEIGGVLDIEVEEQMTGVLDDLQLNLLSIRQRPNALHDIWHHSDKFPGCEVDRLWAELRQLPGARELTRGEKGIGVITVE